MERQKAELVATDLGCTGAAFGYTRRANAYQNRDGDSSPGGFVRSGSRGVLRNFAIARTALISNQAMFDHIGIFVSDTARSFPFFEKALAPLGIVVRERQRKWGSIVMSSDEWPPFLWMGPA